MPEPPDPRRAFDELAARLDAALASARQQSGWPTPLLEPLQLQTDFVRHAVRRQQDLERRVERAVKPLKELVEALERTPEAMRTQAGAFEAAAISFTEAAKVLAAQADAMELALSAIRAPAAGLSRNAASRDDSESTEPHSRER